MRIWLVALIYTLAFMAGLAALWAFISLGVMDYFEGRTNSVFVLMFLPLMAAMCVFSVIYGLSTGVALKWQYWLFGTITMLAIVLIWPRLVMVISIDVTRAFIITVLLVFSVGLLFALRRDAVTTR